MGTLVFVCPTTGHEVSTGVEVDRLSFKSLPRTKTAIFCPRCRRNHMLATMGLVGRRGSGKSGHKRFEKSAA
jgi:hypothetical protein